MSDETQTAEVPDSERDTLPMGHDVSKVELLETIVEGEWKRPAGHVRTPDGPAESYWCELESGRLRFERTGRIWQGFLDDAEAGETRETSAAENIGKVARELKKLLREWRGV